MVAIGLYEPDIALNVGAAMRLAACVNTPLHIIEPCGFPWSMDKMRRAGMDYMDLARVQRHKSWDSFIKDKTGRLILLSTHAAQPYYDFSFQEGDILLAGRESAGVPQQVHETADARLFIPMAQEARSLNVVNALSMVLGEAIRQTRLP